MALICDTSGICALYDVDDGQHEATRRIVERETGSLFLPVVLLAEIDCLLQSRLGADAALDFIEAVANDEFKLIPLTLTLPDLERCVELLTQYRDLEIGLSDATVVAAAERPLTARLLSHDQRHFRAIQPRGLNHFILLPADYEP